MRHRGICAMGGFASEKEAYRVGDKSSIGFWRSHLFAGNPSRIHACFLDILLRLLILFQKEPSYGQLQVHTTDERHQWGSENEYLEQIDLMEKYSKNRKFCMMKRISHFLPLLFLLGMGLPDATFGQNYRPFSNGNIHRFDSPAGFYSIKIDSVTEVGSDSAFWFNKIVIAVSNSYPGNNCGYPAWQGPAYSYGNENLLGTKMLEKSNGEFQFIAETGDTIFIHTDFPTMSNWTFLSNSSLTAMISARTLETFYGTTDSVVTISISDGQELRISKNHGVLTIHNFDSYWSGAPITVYQQRSLPSKPNYLKFYDFEVGDQFGFFQGEGFTGVSYWTDYHDAFEVLSRQDYPSGDSVRYSVARSQRQSGYRPNFIPFDTVMATDTITWTFYRAMQRFLELGTMDQDGGTLLREEFASSNFHDRETFAFTRYALDTCNKTLNGVMDGGNAQKYTIGLGQTLDGWYGIGDVERILTCYVKQTDSVAPCAIPLVEVPEAQANALLFEIYPNPFTEFTTLQFANPRGLRHDLTVTNMTGQVVRKITDIAGDHILLARGELPSGLYFFALKSADGHAGTGKLLVK